nr:hypothetical protein Iba_chr07cCG0670 [Ipomoea batatas]
MEDQQQGRVCVHKAKREAFADLAWLGPFWALVGKKCSLSSSNGQILHARKDQSYNIGARMALSSEPHNRYLICSWGVMLCDRMR